MMFGWIILLVILFYFWNNKGYISRDHQDHSHQDNALEILKERFARGEISFEEFNERKGVLEQ